MSTNGSKAKYARAFRVQRMINKLDKSRQFERWLNSCDDYDRLSTLEAWNRVPSSEFLNTSFYKKDLETAFYTMRACQSLYYRDIQPTLKCEVCGSYRDLKMNHGVCSECWEKAHECLVTAAENMRDKIGYYSSKLPDNADYETTMYWVCLYRDTCQYVRDTLTVSETTKHYGTKLIEVIR